MISEQSRVSAVFSFPDPVNEVSARLVASNAGPARKYYRPTAAGYAALATGTADWISLVGVVDSVLTRPVPSEPIKGA